MEGLIWKPPHPQPPVDLILPGGHCSQKGNKTLRFALYIRPERRLVCRGRGRDLRTTRPEGQVGRERKNGVLRVREVMAPGGKINRPRTELKRKLFKRRRLLGRARRLRRRVVGAVVDAGLTTRHHLRKRATPQVNTMLRRDSNLRACFCLPQCGDLQEFPTSPDFICSFIRRLTYEIHK
ncbi:uncharacterized protein C11orf98 homolog isoform X2 [Cavia porcellus]|uniref:uncharacterized protein C11orf98 homolog isoform X2 n=1 Tax=Cavia porcellus TaxID=10141 RepID=UPI002FE39E59